MIGARAAMHVAAESLVAVLLACRHRIGNDADRHARRDAVSRGSIVA
jgi:hypothetical protein